MKHKVLVVEDEQDTADLLTRILEREGFSVLQAKDGRQASTLIGTVRPPSLVLLDLILPYVSGSELLKLIRQHPDWQHIPIIMLSADHYGPDIQRALLEGATAYVTKQTGSMNLLQAVKRVLPGTLTHDSNKAKPSTTAPRKRRTPVRDRLRNSRTKKRAA